MQIYPVIALFTLFSCFFLGQEETFASGKSSTTAQGELIQPQTSERILPSPLDLKTALSLAGDKSYPDIQIALSEIMQIQAEYDLLNAKNNFKLAAYGQLAATIPSSLLPDNYPDRNTDHELNLNLSKRLYDFGRSSNQLDAFEKLSLSADINVKSQQQNHYLLILNAFFDVVLADLSFSYINEAMSLVYIQHDRAKVYFKQNKISELELLRTENEYNQMSTQRAQNESEQRIKRSILAILLNVPDQLPSDVIAPELSEINDFSSQRELMDIEQLKIKVFDNNLQLKKLSLQIEAEKRLQQSFYAEKYPIISGRLGAGWYSRELGGDDKAIAALSVEIPIYQGGEVDARVLGSLAKLSKFQAMHAQLKLELTQQILEKWMRLKNLKQQYKQVITELSYRELYLDKSRIEYDSELKADLGNAMVLMSKTQLSEKQVLFEIAMQWAELDILMGKEQLYGTQW